MISRKVFRTLFILWSAVILTLTSYPKLQSPLDDSLNFDKFAHVFVYLIFAWLFMKMHGNSVDNKTIKKLILLAVIVPVLDELHQIPIPGRSFSWWDILADMIGFWIIILIYKNKIKAYNLKKENS